ncbi:HNH endonuclease domain-containing protein [Fusarium austroafricanum]|uniref:HNH endonuclease domain-containing protein n=1 Tax=Fusarium austroafricanum TaxID=2364996 RepID=A0A8H4NI59_9HYPO|nr:HNH endonuclease domain-containing protein [Fusarium austroafricanum]
MILLRSDMHKMWDDNRFAILPKAGGWYTHVLLNSNRKELEDKNRGAEDEEEGEEEEVGGRLLKRLGSPGLDDWRWRKDDNSPPLKRRRVTDATQSHTPPQSISPSRFQ